MMVVEGEGTSRPDSAAKAKELWEQLPQRAALEEKFERRMRAYRQRMSEYEKDLAAHAKWHQEVCGCTRWLRRCGSPLW